MVRWTARELHLPVVDYQATFFGNDPHLMFSLNSAYLDIVRRHCEALVTPQRWTEPASSIYREIESAQHDERSASWSLLLDNRDAMRRAIRILSIVHDAVELEDKATAPGNEQQHLVLYPVHITTGLAGCTGVISPQFLKLIYDRRGDAALRSRVTDMGHFILMRANGKSVEEMNWHTVRAEPLDPCGFQFTHSSGDVPTISCNMQQPTKGYVRINDKHIYDAVTALALMMPIYALYTELRPALIGK